MEYIIGQNFYKSLPRNEREKVLNKIRSFSEELARSEGIIREISKGFWIRRIKNTNIFKFRINSGDRCLFSYENLLFENKETSRIVFLEFVEHDKQIKVANRLSNIEINFLEYKADDNEESYDEKIVDNYYDIGNFIGYEIKSDSYLKELIDINNRDYLYYLNKEQYQCLIKIPPILISGSAGSGKTTIGIRKILNIEEFENNYKKVGYFTFNKFLKEETLKLYNKYKNRENKEIHFYTVNDFCLQQLKKEENFFCGYRKFLKWYKDERINNSKLLKNIDANAIWSEIRGIIKGSMLEDWIRSLDLSSNIIDFNFYKELSYKYSDFNEMEREELYNLTIEYNKWLKKNNLYDDNDLAFEVLTNIQTSEFVKFDFIVCDEVQDLTELQIYMLKELTGNKKEIYFSGDIHQIINPNYFSFGRLKNMFYSLNNSLKIPVEILSKNYRSQEKIVKLANKLSEIRKEKIGSFGSEDYIEHSIRDGKMPTLMKYSKHTVEKILRMSEVNAGFVIIVPDDEAVKELKNINNSAMVRKISDIKGLEYNYIATVNIVTNNLKFLNGENRNSARHHFNHFYVAITRAIDELYIIEEDQENFIIAGIENFVERTQDFSNNVEATKSSQDEWSEEARRLEGMGLFSDAALAYKKAFDYEKEKNCIKKYYFETNDYEKAGDYFYSLDKIEAVKCYEKIEDKSLEIQVKIFELQEKNEEIGDLFSTIDREKSLLYYNKALSKNKEKLDLKIKILLIDEKYEEIGNIYLKANKKEKAKDYFLKIIEKNLLIESKILECDNRYEEAGDLIVEENKKIALMYYKNFEKNTKDLISRERIKNKILFCNGNEIKVLDYFIKNENNRFVDLCIKNLSIKKLIKSNMIFINKYFIELVADNNIKGVLSLLRIGINIDILNMALLLVAHKGNSDIAEELINAGANINAKDFKGRAALIIAAATGNEKIVEELIKRKVNLDIQDSSYKTALIWATEKGYKEIVKKLINAGSNLSIKEKSDGNTALIVAVQKGYIDIVKHLINAGAELDLQDNEGLTALIWAAIDGNKEITEYLIEAGVALNIKEKSDGNTALIVAVQEEHIEIAKHLINAGAELNLQDNKGMTALMWAVMRGDVEIVKELVDKGADLNVQNKKGETAIHIALEKTYTNEQLTRLKEYVDNGEKYIDTEVIIKDQEGYIEIAKHLINIGSELNLQDNLGNTAIMLADKKGFKDIVKESRL